MSTKMKIVRYTIFILSIITSVDSVISAYSDEPKNTTIQATITPVASFHQSFGQSSAPATLVNFGKLTFFAATDPLHKRALWASDGTEQGTYLVKDISPSGSSHPSNFVELNNLIYFVAENEKYGRELWMTNGTESGTRLVKDIVPGSDDSRPCCLTRVGNRIFILTEQGLWKTDGTKSGTLLIKDIRVSSEDMIAFNNVFYFIGYSKELGSELWRSDGTYAGTWMIKDINPGNSSALPNNFVISNGLIYFTADDGTHGVELWVTDGSSVGTRMVKDINKGKATSSPSRGQPLNGTLYFSARDGKHGVELWKSDSTNSGTRLVKNILTSGSSHPQELFVFHSVLYFSVYHRGSQLQAELWRSDGTPEGTYAIKNIGASSFHELNGQLYFVGFDGTNKSIWKTDGTSAGTVSLNSPVDPQTPLTKCNGFLLFANNDHATGSEIWRADETTVTLVKDIWTGKHELPPKYLTTHKGKLYFTAFREDVGFELWKSDGRPEGTVLVTDLPPGPESSGPYDLISSGNYLYFYARDIDLSESIFRTDGTEQGTIRLSNVISEIGYSATAFKNDLVFMTYEPTAIWITNGTPQGTVMLKEFDDIYGSIVEANGLLFFWAKDLVYGFELWKTDGSVSGTQIVKDITEGRRSTYRYTDFFMFSFEKRVYFTVFDDFTELDNLWSTDGTSQGTRFIEPLPLRAGGFTVLGNKFYFSALSEFGYVLWKSSGVPGSTKIVQEDLPKTNGKGPNPESLAAINGKLYFSQQAEGFGRELWVSDGTNNGTFMIKDIAPGEDSSGAREICGFDNIILFTANDRQLGPELWTTDGTESATHLLADLLPGGLGSNPYYCTKVGDSLFFIARSPDSYRQLWRLQLN